VSYPQFQPPQLQPPQFQPPQLQPVPPQPPRAAAPKRARNRLIVAVAILACAASAAGFGIVTRNGLAAVAAFTAPSVRTLPAPSSFVMQGKLEVSLSSYSMYYGSKGDGCKDPVSDGYDDIYTGQSVKVTDAAGTTIALGQLYGGVVSGTYASFVTACTWDFEITGVPEGVQFYGVEVADRGVVELDRTDAATPELSLG
jgi:hypothetical protein